ncbi:MAG: Rrf2 family transcriptional regulator [Eubacteriales bacterium]|nr:Rrf2 family transcriptional regulator [Eubacteriales bacterium]
MHISKKCSVAIHCLIFIHEFSDSHKVTSELLSLSSGCNPVIIRNIMSALKKDGIITVKFGTGGAALLCPPEEISLYRICMCVEPDALDKLFGIHQAPSPLCPVGKNIHSVLDDSYQVIRSDMEASLKSVSLKDMLEKYHHLTTQA